MRAFDLGVPRWRRPFYSVLCVGPFILASAGCGSDPQHPAGAADPSLGDAAQDGEGAAADSALKDSASPSSDGPTTSEGSVAARDGAQDGSADDSSTSADAQSDTAYDITVDAAPPKDDGGTDATNNASDATSNASDATSNASDATSNATDATSSATDATSSATDATSSATDAVAPADGATCARIGGDCNHDGLTCCPGSVCNEDAVPHCVLVCASDQECQSSVPGCCRPLPGNGAMVCSDIAVCGL